MRLTRRGVRRLPGILLLTVATLIVIVALLVSGLRLVLPQLDAGVRSCWRRSPPHRYAGGRLADHRQLADFWSDVRRPRYPCRAERWRHNGGQARNLALDVWQSLLHMRWQFRDLTFWQLQVHTTPIQTNDGGESLKPTASAIFYVSSITLLCATAI